MIANNSPINAGVPLKIVYRFVTSSNVIEYAKGSADSFGQSVSDILWSSVILSDITEDIVFTLFKKKGFQTFALLRALSSQSIVGTFMLS